jgi:hypothetical protein
LDAPPDGGPNDPEWLLLEGQPEGVELYVARHPERVLRVEWEDCGVGCRRAVCAQFCAFMNGYVTGGERYARVQIVEPETIATIVDLATGLPVAAWRIHDWSAPRGQLGFVTVGDHRVAISAWATTMAGAARLSTWVSDLTRIASERTPNYQLDTTTSLTIVRNFVSSTHQAWLYSPSSTLVLRDEAGVLVSYPRRPRDGTLQAPHLVGDRIFFELWADHIRVWTATLEEPATVLIDATPGEVRYFRTDGRTMAWLQGYDYDWDALRFARLELWTSPHATRAEELMPRRVRTTFRGLVPTVVGDHWLASQGDGPTMDVYDLRDGSRRNWTPPDGGNVADPPLYATEDEILVTTTVGTFRIDPNTLPVVEP